MQLKKICKNSIKFLRITNKNITHKLHTITQIVSVFISLELFYKMSNRVFFNACLLLTSSICDILYSFIEKINK